MAVIGEGGMLRDFDRDYDDEDRVKDYSCKDRTCGASDCHNCGTYRESEEEI